MSSVRRYRKKPIIVEAMQWDRSVESAEASAVTTWLDENDINYLYGPHKMTLIFPTLEGDMVAQSGDYIIRGIQGEFYPCKPDIFEATYEPVEDA